MLVPETLFVTCCMRFIGESFCCESIPLQTKLTYKPYADSTSKSRKMLLEISGFKFSVHSGGRYFISVCRQRASFASN